MKYLVIFLFLISSSLLKGQEIILFKDSKKEFLIGEKATVITSQNQKLYEFLLKNKIKLMLEGYEVNYQVTQILPDSLLKWEFGIPPINKLVGKDKKLKFDDGTNIQHQVLFNIYSEAPDLLNYNTSVIYSDVSEPQNLTFTFNNAAYIDKIEFIDKKIKIDGPKLNTITSNSSYGFNVNSINNTISINISPNDCENFNVRFYYTGKDTYKSVPTEPLELGISMERKYLNQRFKIATESTLYIDDFESQMYRPKIVFEFEDKVTVGRRYKIKEVSSDIELTTLTGGKEFDMPTNKKVEVHIANIKASGIYEIKITNNSDTLFSTLNILPKPNITEFKVTDSPENVIERDVNKIYSLFVKGNGLHTMSEVQIELVNFNTSQTYPLIKQSNIEENFISTQIKFDLSSNQEIPVGKYYLRLYRELAGKQFKRVYPFYNPQISIEYPKKIIANQVKQVSLFNPEYFFKGDSQPKRYLPFLKEKILAKNSPITIEISPNKEENEKFGPQYIKITTKYHKSDGNEVLLNITEGGNDYITVFNKPIFIDLKDEYAINEFNVNEKIDVAIAHSPEKYGSNKMSPLNKMTYYRGSDLVDKIGITLTIPPYLASFRNVKRKTFSENEIGEIEVKYDGNKKIEFQSLAINAGLGIKYRSKDKFYEPSKFALGLYIMGLDFANVNSVDEQKNEIENHNFIGRGSFNLMCLGEYSFLNLDNPNTRIPLYFGIVYIFDPLDGGSSFAPTFGFGIDIKLFGSN
jgi:hypothetical protein